MLRTSGEFENEENLLNGLAKLLAESKIALVVGAGLTYDFNLPLWPVLIKRLYAIERKRPKITNENLKKLAEDFKLIYCKNDLNSLQDKIYDVLYKKINYNFNRLRMNSTIVAIGALVMASKRGSATNIINFNYDNLLESYLEYHGFITNPIINELHWIGSPDVKIYHPHGFIPWQKKLNRSKHLILDRESFSEIIGKQENVWRQSLLNIMRTHFCLYIGISGEDDNLDSILIELKKGTIVNKAFAYSGVVFNTSGKDRSNWKNRNIYLKQIKNYNLNLPNLLFSICQRAATFVKNN